MAADASVARGDAAAVVLVVSPRSSASRRVEGEIFHAQRHGVPVLPLIIEGQERRGATLAAMIGDLCLRLGGEHPGAVEPAEAGEVLAALLAAAPPTLVVLDDAWFDDQIEPFVGADAGPARFLVTTRVTSLLPQDAQADVRRHHAAQPRAALRRPAAPGV